MEPIKKKFKVLKEGLGIDLYSLDETLWQQNLLMTRLREENKKLKEDNRFLTKISKEYMEKENIVEVTEFTELYKDDLEKENEELKEENKKLKEKVKKAYQKGLEQGYKDQ